MKLFSSFVFVCLSSLAIAAEPNQIVINVERSDFKPLQEVNWRIMAGTTSLTRNEEDSFSGTGLSVGVEKMVTQKWSAGVQYSNVNGIQSRPGRENRVVGNPQTGEAAVYSVDTSTEQRSSLGVLTGFGKFSFVDYPINRWNLLQLNLIGGLSAYSKYGNNLQAIYGASLAYNFDNLIGFELGTKVNLKAEASTNMNLIGYF